MRCPKCGAENSERGVYCGSCSAELRKSAPVEKCEEAPARLPPKLAKAMSGSYIKGVVFLFLIMGMARAVSIITGEADLADWALAAGFFASAIGIFVFWRRLERRGATKSLLRYLTYERGPSDSGPAHTASSMSMAAVAAFAGFGAVAAGFFALAVFIADTTSSPVWVAAAIMGTVILGTVLFFAAKGRNRVTLSEDGIWFHAPLAGFTMHFKRSDLAALEVRGRVLRVMLENPPYGMFRQSRHILLGDSRGRDEFAQAVNSYGLLGRPPA